MTQDIDTSADLMWFLRAAPVGATATYFVGRLARFRYVAAISEGLQFIPENVKQKNQARCGVADAVLGATSLDTIAPFQRPHPLGAEYTVTKLTHLDYDTDFETLVRLGAQDRVRT